MKFIAAAAAAVVATVTTIVVLVVARKKKKKKLAEAELDLLEAIDEAEEVAAEIAAD